MESGGGCAAAANLLHGGQQHRHLPAGLEAVKLFRRRDDRYAACLLYTSLWRKQFLSRPSTLLLGTEFLMAGISTTYDKHLLLRK